MTRDSKFAPSDLQCLSIDHEAHSLDAGSLERFRGYVAIAKPCAAIFKMKAPDA